MGIRQPVSSPVMTITRVAFWVIQSCSVIGLSIRPGSLSRGASHRACLRSCKVVRRSGQRAGTTGPASTSGGPDPQSEPAQMIVADGQRDCRPSGGSGLGRGGGGVNLHLLVGADRCAGRGTAERHHEAPRATRVVDPGPATFGLNTGLWLRHGHLAMVFCSLAASCRRFAQVSPVPAVRTCAAGTCALPPIVRTEGPFWV